jgi:PAS domain S-box-containing protein
MDAVGVYSVDGTLLDANPAHLNLFGLSREDIGRQTVLALYVEPADRVEFLRLLERDGVVVDQEVRLRKTDGEEMYCVRSAVARRDADGRIVTLQTVTRDITGPKLAEQELRDSEARFRALVEYTGLGTAISRTDGEILDCNDVFPRMLGYSKQEVLQLRVPDIYVNLQERESVLAQALRDGFVRDAEVAFRRKDGSSVYVSLNSTLVPQGSETLVVSQFLDITERKAAERELLRSREELQHSAEQLHELTTYLEDAREKERTGIARELHDQLGQALTALTMDLDGVRRAAAAGEPVPADRLDRMATLLDDTVNDVRRISSELRPGILDDAGLIAAIEWQLDRFGERSDIKCTLDAKADDSALDRPRSTGLFRVFQELLTNVARHSGATHVWVVFDRDDGNFILSVSDDGRGITQEQANSESSLGLIGVRERLRPLGGTIEFLRRRPKGSTVRVIMPAK